MKESWQKNKREILIGVIVSIITAIIMKCGDWLAKAVPVVGLSITNYIYYSAAFISDAILTEVVIALIIGILLCVVVVVMRAGLKAKKKLKKTYNELEKQNSNTSHIDKENIVNEDNDTNKLEIVPLKTVLIIGNLLTFALIVIIVFYFAFLNISFIKPAEIHQNFERDITMIHPYVEESKIIQLQSDWVCMQTKADYEEIYEFIDDVKAENDLP